MEARVTSARLYFLPVQTRVPLKFGPEILTTVTCARVRLEVADWQGRRAAGWGETPLSVQWVWPSNLPFAVREQALKSFCLALVEAWATFPGEGHAFEIGLDFQAGPLREAWHRVNAEGPSGREPMPWLAALVCCSAFDLALHDAYGRLLERPIYETYQPPFLRRDLASFLEPAAPGVSFTGLFPSDFLVQTARRRLCAWHLVGGLDPLEPADLSGAEPDDDYPVLLRDWIRRDGLNCLKVKLRGNEAAWDWNRLVQVGTIAVEEGVDWLTADFNCTVREPAYVNTILDRLRREHPRLYGMILYVEQPFPYELDHDRIDVHSVSARKPLFLDESAHDWKLVRRGRELGWNGVALKTCKTQSGALLSACWAAAHGMGLMVQDLTNPMLAQIPHLLLAAHTDTLMGVETNAMQFYPEASRPEAFVHPGIYQRRDGMVDLASISGPGFGYRIEEIKRELPLVAAEFGT